MSFDLEQKQTTALQEMLQLRKPQTSAFGGRGGSFGGHPVGGGAPWKVLIFDEAAKDILAPLMTGTVGAVVSVVERHVGFICLSPCEFSLNLPGLFSRMHGTSGDEAVQAAIDAAAEGLLSVLATLGVVPLINCSSSASSPARSVALRLQEMVEALPAKAFSQMFGSATAAVTKPLLILLDREFDLLTMLQHTWLYGALIHDLLKLRLNRVTVTTASAEGKGSTPKTFDLEKRDLFWKEHAFSPFPVAAAAVSQMLTDYNTELAKMGRSKPDAFSQPGGADFSSDILKAVDVLPDLADKKRSLDAHTTIATALVSTIKERGLDRYFELEQGLPQDREAAVTSAVRQCLAPEAPGTLEDKLRLLACLYVSRPSFPKPQFEALISELQKQGADVASLQFLSKFSAIRSMNWELQSVTPSGTSSASAALEGLGTKFLDKGRGLLQGVKNLLVRKASPIAQLLEGLLEGQEAPGRQTMSLKRGQRSSGPGSTAVSPGGHSVRGSPVRQAIVFVVGGASYVEAAAIRELAARTQKQLIFGSTEFVSPNEFLEELTQLGHE
ncbi:protein sly1 [Cyclospora cayetanensis]|uniref:Protein sly1 n=1 Tax=Cyclospora cayetanensis TaxID=88456 RepID=A0A6P6S2I2_9EIME|nr:protein sly1 [Cyclospora cayetanensis]